MKQVKIGFRKVVFEFCKRIDPDLKLYYHTSAHTRFHEGPLPSFNQPKEKPKKDVFLDVNNQQFLFQVEQPYQWEVP